jgi:hypothetical protein
MYVPLLVGDAHAMTESNQLEQLAHLHVARHMSKSQLKETSKLQYHSYKSNIENVASYYLLSDLEIKKLQKMNLRVLGTACRHPPSL